jgi:DNA mismatch repair protein MutL
MDEPRIRVLPDDLVNQIAAGEVVENPASVVKELVENAVDAGAARIRVEAEGGGLQRVRVVDDGGGMSPDEAVLALQRHATSKIRRTADLDALRTLGFRGEALPSIASVSRFTLVTRRPVDDVGVQVTVEGGRVAARPVACPVGTAVTVEDLFHNVPARLKFQKGERAQSSAVADVVVKAALAFPGLHFSLQSGGRRVLDLPPCERFADRVAACLGRDLAGRLVDLDLRREGLRVAGAVADPGSSRNDATRLVLLVNERPVTDLALRRAVLQAYGVLLPHGRFPVAAVRVDLDPADVDVNVHPRKAEVRFRQARDVAAAVFEAVHGALAGTPWIETAAPALAGDGTTPWGVRPDDGAAPAFPAFPAVAGIGGAGEGFREAGAGPVAWQGRTADLFASSAGAAPRMASLRYVGQVANTVLVCEGEGTLVLVDQHAAHERVNFDRLWGALRSGKVVAEPLLFPEVVRLDPLEAGRLESAVEALAALGFDLEPYSGDSVAVRAVPALLRGRSVAAAVRECVAAASEDAAGSGVEGLHKAVATVACHASVRAGDPLSEADARSILQAMDGVADLSAYCPHGRLSVVVHPLGTVLRWFGR